MKKLGIKVIINMICCCPYEKEGAGINKNMYSGG